MSTPHGGDAAGPERGPGESPGVAAPGGDPPTHRAGRGTLSLVSVLAIYYAVPVGALPSGIGIVISVAALLGGVTLLGWLTVRQVQRLARRTADEAVRLDSLVFLVVVVVPMFALGFFALNDADPDQFVSLDTKTDALYFALSTLATVGFGDVHASGQLARGLVTLQIAFNLVIVATAASLLTAQIRARAAAGRARGDRPDG
ncbi:MAG TPA: potassium channel family protein [Acidimicrobiales bacterium]|nr:potassium channel family protein [Acidimicrobiales bacterium]